MEPIERPPSINATGRHQTSAVGLQGLGTSFQRKLKLTLATICLCTVAIGGVAYWQSVQTAYMFERDRLANAVLSAYLQLSSDTYELYKVIGVRLLPDSKASLSTETDLITSIQDRVRTLRRLIAEEVAFIGKSPRASENEREELERLSKIEGRIGIFVNEYQKLKSRPDAQDSIEGWRAIASLLNETMDANFRRNIKDGIDDELKETAQSELYELELVQVGKFYLQLATLVALAIALVGAGMLLRGVRRPLADLRQGVDAFAGGALAHRIPVGGDDEFAALARSFNAMAAELEAARRASETSRASLERTVEERTRNLADLNASLSASDATRRRFLADLSHELRTPLTIIRGESEIMLRGGERAVAEYKRSLEKILEQASHTAALVDDLLFIARREAGEVRLKFQPVDLAGMITRLCGEFSLGGDEKRVSLHSNTGVADANSTVIADPSRLRQLFVILLDNAMRYSRQDGRIEVSVRTVDDSLVVAFADNGIGIPADDLPFIFERYYRGSNAKSLHSEGVGLGLPVAKAIVEAHNGTVTVESTPEGGTTVTVTLPSAPKLRAVG